MSITIKKACQVFQGLYYKGRLSINSIFGLPAQTSKEIQLFKAIFDNFMGHTRIKIFEWGSGFSTVYYGSYLREKGINFEWHSIDNNEIWHEKVKAMVKRKNLEPYVKLYLKDFIPFWGKPGWGSIPPPCGVFGPKSENEIAYINFPMQFKFTFDIVIIDARFRRHCIETTKKILSSTGIAVLHDAQKAHYHEGLDDFQYGRFVASGSWYPFQEQPNRVWIGSIENRKIFEELSGV